MLVFDGPYQKRLFGLSRSCVLKILVFLSPDRNSIRSYVKFLINNTLTVTLREVCNPSAKYKEKDLVSLGPQGPLG